MIVKIIKDNLLLSCLMVFILTLSTLTKANDLNITIDNNTNDGKFHSVQAGQDNDIDLDIVSMDEFIIDIEQV